MGEFTGSDPASWKVLTKKKKHLKDLFLVTRAVTVIQIMSCSSLCVDGEIFGDFEDLETGEITSGKSGQKGEDSGDEATGDKANGGDEEDKMQTKEERRAEKKRKLKNMFNADYDDGKGM